MPWQGRRASSPAQRNRESVFPPDRPPGPLRPLPAEARAWRPSRPPRPPFPAPACRRRRNGRAHLPARLCRRPQSAIPPAGNLRRRPARRKRRRPAEPETGGKPVFRPSEPRLKTPAPNPPADFSERNVWRVYARVKSGRSPAGILSQPSRTRPFLPHGRLAGFGCAGRGRGRASWRRRQLVQAVRPDLRPLPALPFLRLR